MKAGGGISASGGGATPRVTGLYRYDPELPYESFVRCLREYMEKGFDAAEKDSSGNSIGLDHFYEVIPEWPAGGVLARRVPFRKTLIHFEIDEVDDKTIGYGDQVFAQNYDPVLHVNYPQEAGQHVIYIDLGVWTSDAAGGLTARLRALQVLRNLFYGPAAQAKLWNASDGGDGGLKIRSWNGGRFMTERINDILVYRILDSSAEIEIFSRTPKPDVGTPSVEAIDQNPIITVQ